MGIPEKYLPSRSRTRKDLQAGLTYLRGHGWCRGRARDEDGRVCAIEALARSFREENRNWFDDLPMVARFQVARRHLDKKVSQVTKQGFSTEGYNDYAAKGQKDLEDLYEMAIADV
jgi:hypothetical protein